MKSVKIMAKKIEGGYKLVASNGEYPCEGRVYGRRIDAYKACDHMYAGDVWRGRKVSSGYSITIDSRS